MDRSGLTTVMLALLVVTPALGGCLELVKDVTGDTDGVVVGQRWPLKMTGIDAVQSAGTTGKGVKVAVIDTGISPGHAEFDGVKIAAWKDYVQGRANPYDDNGHGTHVAGIIASQGDWSSLAQGFRIRGGAPGVDLIIIKAISANGKGETSDVARGVDFAVENGAHVIVMSLGGGTFPVLGNEAESAVRRAVTRGVFVVAAAGNTAEGESECEVASPASVEGVIAVGSVGENKAVSAFSCHGSGNRPGTLGIGGRSDPHKKPELVGPGEAILSAWSPGGKPCGDATGSNYCQASGTSQATPYVGAALALLLEERPELKRQSGDAVERVKEKLMTTSENIGPLKGKGSNAHDNYYGYGLIRADLLLESMG